MKTCSKCKTKKEISEFSPDIRSKLGVQSRCRDCCSAATRDYRAKNPEKALESLRSFRLRRPYSQRARALFKLKEIKQYYKTSADVEKAIEDLYATNPRCWITGASEEELGETLHVDHCHKTGKIRGLLTGKINRAIGLLDEDSSLLRLMADKLDEERGAL